MQIKKTFVFAIAIISVDVLCIFISLLNVLWAGCSNYVRIWDISLGLIACPILLAHLVFIFGSICFRKMVYVKIVSLFVLLTVFCCYWLSKLSLKRHDCWFIRNGVEQYSECIEDIKAKKATLNLVNHRVNYLIRNSNIADDVYASTNYKGNLFVIFASRSGFPCADYIFFDGTNKVAINYDRWNINGNYGPYRFIAGSWYEY